MEGCKFVCRGWIYPVLCVRTEDIYLAAGLDAVVMLKTIEYGVQLFVPMAVVCLAVCALPACLSPCMRQSSTAQSNCSEGLLGPRAWGCPKTHAMPGTANDLGTKVLRVTPAVFML